jgi:hypothetical protein
MEFIFGFGRPGKARGSEDFNIVKKGAKKTQNGSLRGFKDSLAFQSPEGVQGQYIPDLLPAVRGGSKEQLSHLLIRETAEFDPYLRMELFKIRYKPFQNPGFKLILPPLGKSERGSGYDGNGGSSPLPEKTEEQNHGAQGQEDMIDMGTGKRGNPLH